VLLHPLRTILPTLAALALAYGLAYGVARWLYRSHEPTIEHGYSAWHWVMGDRPDRLIYATLDLRDGTSVAGYVLIFTVGDTPVEHRELVLQRALGIPICLRRPSDDAFHPMNDRFVVLQGGDVLALSVKHVARVGAGG